MGGFYSLPFVLPKTICTYKKAWLTFFNGKAVSVIMSLLLTGAKPMISKELLRAREYETIEGALVGEKDRPAFHFSPRIGWLNDPNGFSFYEGKYHLFYQYHPYDSHWGPMHWGHAVSTDLINWEYLPVALAPDTDCDGAGCFSGSAVTLPDGRQLLMYTGCDAKDLDPEGKWAQTQCLAVSNGDEYVKYEGNPVITRKDLPAGGDPYEFRDPYIWQAEDGSYRAVVANANKDGNKATQISMFKSNDAFHWSFDKVLFEDYRRIGIMWECPNFFALGGRQLLIASPMDMELEDAEGSIRFPKGNNVCYMVGDYDEANETFTPHQAASHEGASRSAFATYHPVDCGLDFYAPQVMKAPDGRTLMIGWMQDPSTANIHKIEDFRIFGQMSFPRELDLRGNRLVQWPAREMEECRKGRIISASMDIVSETKSIEGLSGRVLDMEIDISPRSSSAAGICSLDEFGIRFARDYDHYVELTYRPDSSVLTVDRSRSGQSDEITKRRSIRVRDRSGKISLRILIDRWSAEVFINGGEQVMSLTYYTPLEAQGITFSAEGSAIVDLTAYELIFDK